MPCQTEGTDHGVHQRALVAWGQTPAFRYPPGFAFRWVPGFEFRGVPKCSGFSANSSTCDFARHLPYSAFRWVPGFEFWYPPKCGRTCHGDGGIGTPCARATGTGALAHPAERATGTGALTHPAQFRTTPVRKQFMVQEAGTSPINNVKRDRAPLDKIAHRIRKLSKRWG